MEILAPQNSIKALKALEKYVRKAIRIANGITLYSDKPKIVALIGPTGVGKTTSLRYEESVKEEYVFWKKGPRWL